MRKLCITKKGAKERAVASVFALAVALSHVAGVLLSQTASAAGESINSPAASSSIVNVASGLSGISIDGTGNDQISVELSVDDGNLAFGSSSGLTFSPSGTTTGSVLHIQGTRSAVNAALATLIYTRSTTGTANLRIALVEYGEVLYPVNGHLYEYVSTPSGITWSDAESAASQSVKYGAAGYLATITSAEENSYIYARLLGVGWIGGSDSASEGNWQWVQGPEAGMQFWQGNAGGSAVDDAYVNWDSNQPDNANWYPGSSDENCAQMGILGTMKPQWNDMPCIYPMPGYVVEYGAPDDMPNIPEKNMTIYTTALGEPVDDGDGVPAELENDGPHGGDGNDDGTLDSLQPHVASLPDPISGRYVTLVVDESCELSGVSVTSEGNHTAQDSTYDYTTGFLNFTASDCDNSETDVELYYHGILPDSLAARKYNPHTETYFTITSASLSVLDSPLSGTLISYTVIDNDGQLDINDEDDVITDPVGLGTLLGSSSSSNTGSNNTTPGAPNTGLARQNTVLFLIAGVVGIGLLLGLVTPLREKVYAFVSSKK